MEVPLLIIFSISRPKPFLRCVHTERDKKKQQRKGGRRERKINGVNLRGRKKKRFE
jgi:hypothetical protein